MKTEDTVEYNSLRWVKKELDLILQEAQASLSAYIEDTEESGRLRESVEHLHMVQGTLQMVELYGAAQLAEEMEKVSEALLNGKIEKVDDAYDVLMRSMLQLPDYLESLQSGSKDVPMVLLPLLNDLRASRNASLLSESVLFFPDVESESEEIEAPVDSGELVSVAKKLRPHYQIGLVGWFKGEKVQASLKRINAVLCELEKKSSQTSVRRIWSISAALIEGLEHKGIDSNVSIKMLLGQVDRSIKQLVDSNEIDFAENAPAELLKNLLYYVARIKGSTPRVIGVKSTYRLDELLPDDTELEEARSGMGGLNTELLSTVSSGIREDLLEVKDVLEIFVHSDVQDVSRLQNLPELLTKIADTLSMLGLGMPREQVMQQHTLVGQIVSGEHDASDETIMGMASVLLSVESQLNSFIANRSSIGDESSGPHRLGDLGTMPESEYVEVLSAVIKEALQDFNEARQAILSYLESPQDKSLLEMILHRLREVDGAMFMLPVQKLKHQIDAIHDYVEKVMLNAGKIPDVETQNDLADVVTSIEYYLEAILEGRPDLELSMNSGNAAADRLNEISSKYASVDVSAENIADESPAVETELVEVAVEPEEVQQTADIEDATEQADDVPIEERYVILGDDADEEILEIFIEEALEELASLNEQVPMWARDHGNEDALTTIRRSFHTLKGSGRLIGAELIGEFAWNFENMLNRVIDKSCPLTQEVFDVLNEALAVLPQLIEQLKGNREPVLNVYQLMDKADELGKWKKPETETSRISSTTPSPSVSETEELVLDDLSAETLDVVDDSVETGEELIDLGDEEIDPHTSIEISEDEVMPEISEEELVFEVEEAPVAKPAADTSASSEDGHDDEFDIDLTDELEALQIAVSDDEVDVPEVVDAATETVKEDEDFVAEDTLQIYIDPVLFDIFKGESENHIKQIRMMLEQHKFSNEPLTANADLLRALHTLFGSARTAEVEEIAELCGELEKYVRLYLETDDLCISDEGVQLVDEVNTKVASMLEELSDKNQPLKSDQVLLGRIRQLSQNFQNTPAPLSKTEDDVLVSNEPVELIPEPVVADEPVVEESLVSYSEVDDELVDIFLEEAEELLDNCENSLQRWNSDSHDEESVQDLQRHLHTLKGGARMADLSPVGNLTHALESLVIAVNDGQVSLTKDMSNALHDSLDQLSDMLAKVKERKPISSAESLISHIDALREGKDTPTKPALSPSDEDEDPEPVAVPVLEEDSEFVIDDGDDPFGLELPEDLISSDDDFGFEIPTDSETSAADMPSDELLSDAATEKGYSVELSADAILDEEVDIDQPVTVSLIDDDETVLPTPEERIPVSDGLESVEKSDEDESSTLVLDKGDSAQPVNTPPQKDGIANEQVRVRSDLLNDLVNHAGEVSVYHARMGQQISNFSFNLSEMEQTVVRLREQLRQLSIETEAQILSRYEKESDQYDEDFDPLEMDRFSTMQQISRSLQETVGDMESIKDLLAEEVRDSETLLLQESRVSTELQEGLMRTRMVHFGGLASRLRRIVRQTARELDKDVELEISGETSEVDRTVLDKIVAPLEHMLRNAVSHGIELPAERLNAGKAESGRLDISVDREGGDVVILVKDDGRGIDVSAVRKKASEKGLLDADSKLSDHDVLQYIMEPGFSTAEHVTQISGRGVGMDVVDSEIKQLGGVLEIDTVQGKGTTFTIRLPLTLAINHALLVNVGEDVYAVPLNSIEGVVRLSGPELQQFYNSGETNYEFAGSGYELKHLGQILTGVQPDYSRSGQLFPVLLARAGDQSVALHVDELIGRREIVVKPVGAQISTVRGISGATILGDGRVVLILEMNALVLGDSLFHVASDEMSDDVTADEVPQTFEEYKETIVMVVDDSITIRKVTERMLSRHNMKVITAKDGVDAVSQLQEVKPDIMLLDIEMPRMDGYEVATHVRNDERLKDLPIIMITSRSGTKHRDKAMEIGVNKYLGKPYQEDDLMENINELLG